MIYISILIKRQNNLLLPLSLRFVRDLIVDLKSLCDARSADALQIVQHVNILGHGHQLPAGLTDYLLEGLQSLEVAGREVGYDQAGGGLNALSAGLANGLLAGPFSIGGTGPRSFGNQNGGILGPADELAGGLLLFAVQAEVAVVSPPGCRPWPRK
jgi:hypothetical protein